MAFFSMSFAFRLLILLIGLSPLFLAFDSLLIHGILAAYVALMVVILAWAIRRGEAVFLSEVIRPAVLFAIVPAIWIVFQSVPLPFDGLRHPIWSSAEAALGRPLWGSISISPGDSLVGLARYFSTFGLFLVATAISLDRRRAEIILLCLSGMTTLLALLLIGHDLGGFFFLGEISSTGARASIAAATALGTVLASTTVVYAIERYETRRRRADFNRRGYIAIFGAAIGALIITLVTVVFFTSKPVIFATLSGLGTFILIVVFHRIGLEGRMGFVLAGAAVAVPLSIIAGDLVKSTPDLSIRFVTDAPKPLVELTQRIITDSSWLGSGAGTFAALIPIYQETNNAVTASVAPTAAAGVLIELGRPAMWIAVAAALAAIAWLVRGALQRGRDSFFTAAGASCAVVLTLQAFFNASAFGSTTIVIATTVFGLAVSQSVSRRTGH
jgi:hypothetical protein